MLIVAAFFSLTLGLLAGLAMARVVVALIDRRPRESAGSYDRAVNDGSRRVATLWLAVALVASGVGLLAIGLRFPAEILMALGFILTLHSAALELVARLRPGATDGPPRDL